MEFLKLGGIDADKVCQSYFKIKIPTFLDRIKIFLLRYNCYENRFYKCCGHIEILSCLFDLFSKVFCALWFLAVSQAKKQLYGFLQGRRHGFEVEVGTISLAVLTEKILTPHLLLTWGQETEHCTFHYCNYDV